MATYLLWLTATALEAGMEFDTPPLQCTLFREFDWNGEEVELIAALEPVFKNASPLTLTADSVARNFGPNKDMTVRLIRCDRDIHIRHIEVYKVLQRYKDSVRIHNPEWAGMEGYRPHVARYSDEWLHEGGRLTVHHAHLVEARPDGRKAIVAQFQLGG